MARAKAAAGGGEVVIQGAYTAQRAPDEPQIHQVPVLATGGRRDRRRQVVASVVLIVAYSLPTVEPTVPILRDSLSRVMRLLSLAVIGAAKRLSARLDRGPNGDPPAESEGRRTLPGTACSRPP